MSNRLYSNKHLWVLQEGDTATIGITDFLQEKLGAIMLINLPSVGDEFSVGECFGDLESKKTVMEMESPISGKVLEVNESLLDDPSQINNKPYDSWFIRVKVSLFPNTLMDEDAYSKKTNQPWMQNH